MTLGQGTGQDKAPAPKDPAGAPSAQPAERVIYDGRISAWEAMGPLGLSAFALLVGLVLSIWSRFNDSSFLLIVGLAALIAGALGFGYAWLAVKSIRYKITTRLVERETGILSRQVDTLDLYRARDVVLKQSLLERILRLGRIEILSSDSSDPDMVISGLKDPRPIYEAVRETVLEYTRRKGVMLLDR